MDVKAEVFIILSIKIQKISRCLVHEKLGIKSIVSD
jgi:hypothetical protein